jgi:hypothetical protein
LSVSDLEVNHPEKEWDGCRSSPRQPMLVVMTFSSFEE